MPLCARPGGGGAPPGRGGAGGGGGPRGAPPRAKGRDDQGQLVVAGEGGEVQTATGGAGVRCPSHR